MIKTNPLSVKNIERIALELRDEFNVKETEFFPIIKVLDTFFEKNLLSYQIVDNDTKLMDESCVAIYNAKENFIYIKRSVIEEYEQGIYRSAFTLCHELFHFIQNIALKFEFEECDKCKYYEDVDWQANEFAGQVLIPTKYLALDEETMQKMYHVSLECALTRKAKAKKRLKK